MDFVQGEVHAKCTGGLVRCSPRHKMVIPRHVVFLAVGCGRRRAPARHCKSERHGKGNSRVITLEGNRIMHNFVFF